MPLLPILPLLITLTQTSQPIHALLLSPSPPPTLPSQTQAGLPPSPFQDGTNPDPNSNARPYPPAPTGLSKRACIDTTFTGDLLGYYWNPNCGFDEFRCLPSETMTTTLLSSSSFFNCAPEGSTASPWPTTCENGKTIGYADPGVESTACGSGCNTVLQYEKPDEDPLSWFLCGIGGTTVIFVESSDVPVPGQTSTRSSSSSSSTADTTTTETPSSSSTGSSTPPISTEVLDISPDGPPIGAIVGGTVGGIAVLAIALVIIAVVVRGKRKKENSKQKKPPEVQPGAPGEGNNLPEVAAGAGGPWPGQWQQGGLYYNSQQAGEYAYPQEMPGQGCAAELHGQHTVEMHAGEKNSYGGTNTRG